VSTIPRLGTIAVVVSLFVTPASSQQSRANLHVGLRIVGPELEDKQRSAPAVLPHRAKPRHAVSNGPGLMIVRISFGTTESMAILDTSKSARR
jgi:hypothetical protein